MLESDLVTEKRPAVRLAIVGGDLRALGINWPKWCDPHHFMVSRNTIRSLESSLKAGKLDAVIMLTRWSNNDVRTLVKKWATCPVRYWDRGLGELRQQLESVIGDEVFNALMQKEVQARELEEQKQARAREQEKEKQSESAKKEETMEKKIEVVSASANGVMHQSVPMPATPAIVVPPAPPAPPPPGVVIAAKSPWSNSDTDALVLALEQCGGRASTLVNNYRTLMPASQRSSMALGSKLRQMSNQKKVVISDALIAAVNMVDKYAHQKEPTEQSPRGRTGEWILIEEAAKITGRSHAWVNKHRLEKNIRSRQLPGYPVEYSLADSVRLARMQDSGRTAYKMARPNDDVGAAPPRAPSAPPPPSPPVLVTAPTAPSKAPVPAPPPLTPPVTGQSFFEVPPPPIVTIHKNLVARIKYILLGVEIGEKTPTDALAAIARLVQS